MVSAEHEKIYMMVFEDSQFPLSPNVVCRQLGDGKLRKRFLYFNCREQNRVDKGSGTVIPVCGISLSLTAVSPAVPADPICVLALTYSHINFSSPNPRKITVSRD